MTTRSLTFGSDEHGTNRKSKNQGISSKISLAEYNEEGWREQGGREGSRRAGRRPHAACGEHRPQRA